MTSSEALIGILGAVVVGSLLAAGVAVALSPLAPIGPVRPVYPDPGVSFDWTVLGARASRCSSSASAPPRPPWSSGRARTATVSRRRRAARRSGAARAAAPLGHARRRR